jgi:ferredoxin-NADP reductase
LLAPDLERQYSLCGEPNHPEWTIAVKKVGNSRGGSRYVHESLNVGDELMVRPPRNNFRLVPADRYVFIAGGIGITPILPMVREAVARGVPWELHFAVRHAAAVPFGDELMALPSGVVKLYSNDRGNLLRLADAVTDLTDGSKVYCCGPAPMMDELEGLSASWEPSTLHLERFAAEPVVHEGDHPFTVHLAQTRGSVEVGARESILDALRRNGTLVPSSCREGVCGTCETPVLSGDIDHRDSILTLEEKDDGDYMMLCVSRARGSELTLDL